MSTALSQTIASVKVYKASGFLRETALAAAKRVLPDDDVLTRAFEHVYDGEPLPGESASAPDAFHALTQPPAKTVPVQSIVPPDEAVENTDLDKGMTSDDAVAKLVADFEGVEQLDAEKFVRLALERKLKDEEAHADEYQREAAESREKELAAKTELDRLYIENHGHKLRKQIKVSPEDEARFAKLLREQAGTAGPKTNVSRMDLVKKKKLYWLWEHRIPFGFLSTIAGDPDEGKSLITLYLAACVSKGEKLYGNLLDTEPGEILLLSAEDDPETTLRPRLEAAGAALDRIHLLESVMLTDGAGQEGSERLAQLDTDIKAIERILDENPAITLIVIDPISSFLGAANMNREQEVRRVLEPLRRRARKSGIAVVMVAHFNKNSETRSAMDRVGGAKAIVGMGRAAWTCIREPKKEQEPGKPMQIDQDRHLFLKLKANLTPSRIRGLVYAIQTKMIEVEDKHGRPVKEEQPYIMWLEETSSTAQEVVIGGEGEKTVPKSTTVKQWLKTFLESAGGYATSSDVRDAAKAAGYSQTTLYRAVSQLQVKQTWGGEHTSLWALPDVTVPTAGLDAIKVDGVQAGGVEPEAVGAPA